MAYLDKYALAALHLLPAETAHTCALAVLAQGFVPVHTHPVPPILRTQIAGMDMHSPIGLAAGFDKNCIALPTLAKVGFGFIEGGGITLHAQYGNPRPRVFRVPNQQAIINRSGFNNAGAYTIVQRLQRYAKTNVRVPIGMNIGINKNTQTPIEDFTKVAMLCAPLVDFVTLNVSSPNTQGLREWQHSQQLHMLLLSVRQAIPSTRIFLKIAPDLHIAAIKDIARLAIEHHIDAIIATNTTIKRTPAQTHWPQGGLSGMPLFAQSTRILAHLYTMTQGRIALIGVGGVDSASRAYEKIKAGASAVQLYTALTYHGFSVLDEIHKGLVDNLQQDGFSSIQNAVGTAADIYAQSDFTGVASP